MDPHVLQFWRNSCGSEKSKTGSLEVFPVDLEVLLRAEPGKMNLAVSIGIFGQNRRLGKLCIFYRKSYIMFDNFT